MEKSDRERQSTEPDDSHDVRIAEEMVDEPEKQQASTSQMEGDQSAREVEEETADETPEGLTGSATCESEQILQPKVEEHKTFVSESVKQDTIQPSEQTADDAATEELPKPSETAHCRLTVENVVEKVSDVTAERNTGSLCSEEQNKAESDRQLEVGRQVEQLEEEFPVQQAQQTVELVHEEAAICDARQERMEEASDIEEPQKYAFREKDD